MHDTNPNPNKRMPPLIVLGLTGPIGSGCTTVSNRIFDDPDNPNRGQGNELLKILSFVGWITPKKRGGFTIKWNRIYKGIDQTYKRLSAVDRAIKEFDICREDGDLGRLEELCKKLKEEVQTILDESIRDDFDFRSQLESFKKRFEKKLKNDLEIREAIKALDKLNIYRKKETHLFRTISVSDLIVFRALMAIEKEDFDIDGIKDANKRRKYKQFVTIAKKHMNDREAKLILKQSEVEGYGDYYKRCYDWKNKDERDKLGKAFYSIHKVARAIKSEFYKNYPYECAEVMQDFGNNIRWSDDPFGVIKTKRPEENAYKLAKGVAQMIYLLYKTNQGAFFVIDCLRNPYEVIYLRREFANFFLLGLYADRKTRMERFVKKARRKWGKKFDEDEVRKIFQVIDERDSGKNIKGDEVLYKQNITKCVQISHIAINNVHEWTDIRSASEEEIDKVIEVVQEFCRKPLRMLCLILSPGCTKPNDDELWMNMAYAMAVKSNCISRQVGAVIIGPGGYVVGAGWNDVGEGKISCGLRAIRDLHIEDFKPHVKALLGKQENEEPSREEIESLIRRLRGLVEGSNKVIPAKQFCFCFKDEMAKRIVTGKIKEARDDINKEAEEKGKIEISDEKIESLVEKAEVHQLEYCLALHAEENAIIQSAKIGGMGLKEGTIYVTSQPCSLCAKKIQQIGLSKVVYTEAYSESLSEVYMKGVDLEQFEGVKPRAYIRLFMPHHDQKEWQYLESRDIVPKI